MIVKRLLATFAVCIALQGMTQHLQAGKPYRKVTANAGSPPVQGNYQSASNSRFAPTSDRRLHVMDHFADLEVSAGIVADYHYLGFWYNHRIEIEIRNVDTSYSGPLRTYEVGTVSFSPGGGKVLSEGFIPSLAPGETDTFSVSVPYEEFLESGLFYVRLSPDKDTGNDLTLFTF